MKPFERAFRALILSLAFAALGSVPHTAHANPPAYTLTDLGTLPGGTSSSSAGVNGGGQVTGQADTMDNATHAFLSAPNGGALQDLGTLPGGYFSIGWGVNAGGQVTGQANTSGGSNHAFLSGPNGGPLQDLGLFVGGTFSNGMAVNASGQVTGRADSGVGRIGSNHYDHAFLSGPNGGALQDLGTLPGDSTSEGFSVNASGQVVGYSRSGAGELRAFLYSGGVMTDLGAPVTPGSAFARFYIATGITDSGVITGQGLTTGFDPGSTVQTHAFLLTPILGGPKITVTASASAANGTGQRTITLTTTNTGGASANTLQITAVTLGGAAPVPPSSVPTTPSTLLNTPGMNTQTNGFVFKPLPGTRVAVLHVVGRYTDPNNQITGTFVATIRLPLP